MGSLTELEHEFFDLLQMSEDTAGYSTLSRPAASRRIFFDEKNRFIKTQLLQNIIYQKIQNKPQFISGIKKIEVGKSFENLKKNDLKFENPSNISI